jgi:FAD binding domain
MRDLQIVAQGEDRDAVADRQIDDILGYNTPSFLEIGVARVGQVRALDLLDQLVKPRIGIAVNFDLPWLWNFSLSTFSESGSMAPALSSKWKSLRSANSFMAVPLIGATPRVLRQALYDRQPLAEWRVGRVVLLGDAAHPMMPFYVQGAGQSIEDGYILAGCLALRPDEPLVALEQYVRLRQPRTAWIQELSRREEELYHLADQLKLLAATPGYGRTRVRAHSRPSKSVFTVTMRRRSCARSDRWAEPVPHRFTSRAAHCSFQHAGSGASRYFRIMP